MDSVASRLWLALLLSCVAAPVTAQPPSIDRVSFDSVVAIDKFVGQGAVDLPNVVIDATVVARIADGWIVYVRPWIRHDPRTEVWNNEIYQAALQIRTPRPDRRACRRRLYRVADWPRADGFATRRQSDDHDPPGLCLGDAGLRSWIGSSGAHRGHVPFGRTVDDVHIALGRENGCRQLCAQSTVRHPQRRQSAAHSGRRGRRRNHSGCGTSFGNGFRERRLRDRPGVDGPAGRGSQFANGCDRR